MQFSENKIFCISSDDGIEETLLPIPNRKVKLYNADGTARVTLWESRKLPSENIGKTSSYLLVFFVEKFSLQKIYLMIGDEGT